jgi:flagellar hook-length control protein FliK
MLSGLSLVNIPTAASLSNAATQQVQPTAAEDSNSSQAAETNNHAEANAANNANQAKEATSQAAEKNSNQETKDFKNVMDKTVSENQETKSSEPSTQVEANTNTQDTDSDEIETEEIAAVVSQVMATITTSLASVQTEIELDLDLKDLSVEELGAYQTAIELIDNEVQAMMSDTIDQISDIEMTDLGALTEKSEQLDDLQSLHEELCEGLDEIDFLTKESTVEVSAEIVSQTSTQETKDTGIKLEGFEATEEIEYKAVNADIKPEKEKEKPQEEQNQVQLKQEINLEAIKRDKPQEQQFETNIKQEVEVQKVEDINNQATEELGTEMQVQDQAVKAESKEKSTAKSDSFLDKIKFISSKQTSSTTKEQVNNKANLDANTRQAVIQAANEIKANIKERAQSRIEQYQEQSIEIDLQPEIVDVTDNNPASMFGRLVSDTFKQLNMAPRAEAQSFSPKEVLNLVHDKVIAAPTNTQQELKFQLNPRNLGNITITINKDASGVHIQMVADTDAAVSTLKQDMSNLSSALKEKGLDLKDIDISKASSEGAYNQQQQRGDFNEAREEQKKRMAEDQPHWLHEEGEKPSFENQLKGMLNLWRSKV